LDVVGSSWVESTLEIQIDIWTGDIWKARSDPIAKGLCMEQLLTHLLYGAT